LVEHALVGSRDSLNPLDVIEVLTQPLVAVLAERHRADQGDELPALDELHFALRLDPRSPYGAGIGVGRYAIRPPSVTAVRVGDFAVGVRGRGLPLRRRALTTCAGVGGSRFTGRRRTRTALRLAATQFARLAGAAVSGGFGRGGRAQELL
jgi:hypothetical protein